MRPPERGSMTRLAAVLAAALTLFVLPCCAQAATLNVTKTADTNDTVCDSDCSLREAIGAANGLAGADTINVPAGTYKLTITGSGEDADATGDLDITDDTTIQGAGAGATGIDATGLGDRVFNLPVFSTTNAVTISDLTITRG